MKYRSTQQVYKSELYGWRREGEKMTVINRDPNPKKESPMSFLNKYLLVPISA